MKMFNTSDRQQLSALARCKAPDMQPLLKLFENSLEDLKTSLTRVDETDYFRRLQGKAQVIEDFLKAVEDASLNLERLR